MPLERRTARVAREECALSPRSASGVVRPARSLPWDAQLGQRQLQRRGVTGLPWRDAQDEREAAAVDEGVGLDRQTAPERPMP